MAWMAWLFHAPPVGVCPASAGHSPPHKCREQQLLDGHHQQQAREMRSLDSDPIVPHSPPMALVPGSPQTPEASEGGIRVDSK